MCMHVLRVARHNECYFSKTEPGYDTQKDPLTLQCLRLDAKANQRLTTGSKRLNGKNQANCSSCEERFFLSCYVHAAVYICMLDSPKKDKKRVLTQSGHKPFYLDDARVI